MTSLPIQDLELFSWAYLYQLGFQASFSRMDLLFRNSKNSDDVDAVYRDSVAMMIYKCLHDYGGSECEWICNTIDSSLRMEVNIRRQRRILRITVTLVEPGFISELGPGASPRDLRRLSFFNHMNLIVENALDTILAGKELLQER